MPSILRRVRLEPALLILLLALLIWLTAQCATPLAAVLHGASLILVAVLAALAVRRGQTQTRHRAALQRLEQLLAAPPGPAPLPALASLALELVPSAARAAVYLCDPQGRLQYASAVAPAPAGGSPELLAAPALAQRALQERHALRASELAPGAALADGHKRDTLLPAYAIPLVSDETPAGVLVLFGRQGQALSRQDETNTILVALATGLLLREQRLRQALSEDTPHGTVILNALTDALLVLDQDDRIVLHNPALAGILGPNLEGLSGVRLQVRSTDVRIQRLAYLVGDTSSERPSRRRLTIDEPIRAILDVEITPVHDHAGRWLRIVTMHDVTSTSDALDAQTLLLRATAHGLQAPLAALSSARTDVPLAQTARQLERLRQDLQAVAEPMENLAQSATPTVRWETVLQRLYRDLPEDTASRLKVHAHPSLDAQPVPDRWLDHLLLTLLEETARREAGSLSLDVEGKPGEMVFSVRTAPTEHGADGSTNSLGFGASQTTLSLHVAHRLAEALGGYLWAARDAGALRYQLILPTARRPVRR